MGGLAFTKDKNQIATPWHIAEFLSDLFDADSKTVLDPTAGAGAMLKKAGRPLGVEYDSKAFEMLREEIPHGEIINASIFDCSEWIKERKPEVVMMNPPFNCSKASMPEEYQKKYGAKGTDSTKGLYFVRWVADAVGSGRLAAIVPMGAVKSGVKAIEETKKELLERHTVEAAIKLNPDLFYPSVSVQVVVLILRLGEPYSGKTWFADFSDDGLEKDRTQGRIDKNGKWTEIKRKWLDLFEMKPDNKKQGQVEMTAEQDWNSLWPRDFDLTPTEDDFKKTVKDYLDWKIKQEGYEKVVKEILTPEEYLRLLRRREAVLKIQIRETERKIAGA